MMNTKKAVLADRGFTLLEMTILMALAGLVMSMFITANNQYMREKRFSENYEKLQVIDNSISSFAASMANAAGMRYPCPAAITYPDDHPQAGVEDCTLRASPIGTCDAATGICKVRGRATDLYPAGGGVLIGALPYKTIKEGGELKACFDPTDPQLTVACSMPGAILEEICYTTDNLPIRCSEPGAIQKNDMSFKQISIKDVFDSWGQQMTYAVTEALTDSTSFRATYGAISLETEDGVSLVSPEGSVHFVVISHGENKLGSYSRNGAITFGCPVGTEEGENCDWGDTYANKGDAEFVSGLHMSNFDDMTVYRAYALSEIWRYSEDGQDIYNLNDGNVGVGIGSSNLPEEKLDVGGDLRVLNSISADQICGRDDPDSKCWTPDILGGDVGLMCDSQGGDPADTIRPMVGISEKQAVCSDVPVSVPNIVLPATCPGNQFIKGFYTDTGLPICEDM